MRRVEDALRPHAAGPEPGSTDNFKVKFGSVEEILSAREPSLTHIFPRVLIAGPLPLNRLTLLFILQALLAACGGGGGGGGGSGGSGPVTAAAPPVARQVLKPPESPESPVPPEPPAPPVPTELPQSPETQTSPLIVNNGLEDVTYDARSDGQMAEPPTILDPDWMDERHREMNERIVGAKAPGQSPPDLSVSAFTMSAHRLVIEPAPSKWDEDSNPQEMERRPRRNDNDLLVTLPGKRGPPADDREPLFGSGPLSLTRNFKIKVGDFNFESDRVRDPDGDPHFLIELQARSIPQDPESQPPGQLITTRVFRLRIQNLDEYAPSFEEQPWQAESHTEVIAADAETSFAVKAIDRDRFDTVRYELAEATSDNDNHLVSFDYGSNSIRFAAGMFDFEQALRSEDGRRYFLIEIAAISDATGSVHELTHTTRSFRIWIADADDTPTSLQLSNTLASLAETADVSSRTKVADLDVSDADSDAAFLRHSFTLSGRHRELFEVAGGALYLKAGTLLDHETAPRLEVTVSLDGTTFTADYRLAIDDRNDTPLRLSAAAQVEVDEGGLDTGHVVRAVKQDDAGGPVRYAITGGADRRRFTVDEATGALRFHPEKKLPDHEKPRDRDRDNVYDVEVTATSASLFDGDATQRATQTVGVRVRDVNDVRPVVTSGGTASVDENIAANNHAGQRGDAFIIYRATARKDDTGPALRWELGGADAAAFGINDDGEVWFRQSPDYDGDQRSGRTGYSFTATAISGALRSEAHHVRVTVANRLDETPVLTPPGRLSVDETETGTTSTDFGNVVVARLAATTREAGPEPVHFIMMDVDNPYFQVSEEGVITLRQAIDHEALTERQKRDGLQLVVAVYQQRQGEGMLRSEGTVLNVHVNDLPDPIVQSIVYDPATQTLTASVPAAGALGVYLNDIRQVTRGADGSGGFATQLHFDKSAVVRTDYWWIRSFPGVEDETAGAGNWRYHVALNANHNFASVKALPQGYRGSDEFLATIVTDAGQELARTRFTLSVTGINDAPVARNKALHFLPSLTKAHVFDESFFDFTEFDIDQSTGRPEAWSLIRLTNFANVDSVFWTGDPATLGATGLSGTASYSLRTLYQHGVRHLDFGPNEIGNLVFRWSQDMIDRIILGQSPQLRVTYQVFDQHDAGSSQADLYFHPHMAPSGNVLHLGSVQHKQVHVGAGEVRNSLSRFVEDVYSEKREVSGVDNSGFFSPTHIRFVSMPGGVPWDGARWVSDHAVFQAHHLFNPNGNHASPTHTTQAAKISTTDFAFRSIGENGYRDYQTAVRESGNSPDYFSDSSFIIGFHLSADGGHSWSRLIYYYSDTNMRAVTYVFREYTNQIGNPRADNELGYLYGQHEFFDNDVGSLGETLGEPGVNHIWGYGESEKLWFGGNRKLSFGNLNTVYFKMRDVGGDPGIRDTVLFNHHRAEHGPGPNMLAVLYDYTIDESDLAAGVTLLGVPADIA